MHGLDFLRLGPDYLSSEASFIWYEDVLYGTNVFNVDQTVSDHTVAYDPLEHFHRRPADDALDFPR